MPRRKPHTSGKQGKPGAERRAPGLNSPFSARIAKVITSAAESYGEFAQDYLSLIIHQYDGHDLTEIPVQKRKRRGTENPQNP